MKGEEILDSESYYSTLLHELTHWTGHSSRLNRFFSWSLKINSEAYAREELVAENAIFKAAQDARKATDFIMSFRDEATNEVKVAS